MSTRKDWRTSQNFDLWQNNGFPKTKSCYLDKLTLLIGLKNGKYYKMYYFFNYYLTNISKKGVWKYQVVEKGHLLWAIYPLLGKSIAEGLFQDSKEIYIFISISEN